VPWGFQLTIRLRSDRAFSGEEGALWNMPAPVGKISINGVHETSHPARIPELTFRGLGFQSHAEAYEAAITLQDWLRLVGAFHDEAFDVGRKNEPQSSLGEEFRDRLTDVLAEGDQFLVPDVHGIVCFEETANHPIRFSIRVSEGGFFASRSIGALVDDLRYFAETEALAAEQSLACEIIALALRQRSVRLQMVSVVTAMELLTDDRGPGGQVSALVESFKSQVQQELERSAEASDELGLQSLLRSLSKLSEVSISESLRQLARRARPDNPEEAASLVDRIYSCRSDLVHGNDAYPGGYSEALAEELWPLALALAKDMLRVSVDG
jgi:hypothetical protein